MRHERQARARQLLVVAEPADTWPLPSPAGSRRGQRSSPPSSESLLAGGKTQVTQLAALAIQSDLPG